MSTSSIEASTSEPNLPLPSSETVPPVCKTEAAPARALLPSLELPPAPTTNSAHLSTWPTAENEWYPSTMPVSIELNLPQSFVNTPELDSATWSDMSASPSQSLFDEPLFTSSPTSASTLASPFSWFTPATIPSSVGPAAGYADPTLSLPMLPFGSVFSTYGVKTDESYWPTTPSFEVNNMLAYSPFSMT
ncbi:hypothetical protein OIV83_001680 [Microbotryomycetes sp. JL201]|nr:hypothetical protein OIV83_001680 [Microbotryomycetes sp. JL201]